MTYAPLDLAVVGAGIIGLATAREALMRCSGLTVRVLEKEPQVATHQTTHNSGVIHSGISYRPGSLKAKTCVAGARLMVEFCEGRGIPVLRCGKLVVASQPSELPALEMLYQRGCANGVQGLTVIGPERMREIEPHARGLKALRIPSTSSVDFGAVARALAEEVRQRGGEIVTSAKVTQLTRREDVWVAETTSGEVRARSLITCGGLHADRLAAMAGGRSEVHIVPFRGEYYELVPERRDLVKGMIYPVPHPALPFLGVHFTRTVAGGVLAGPNAVLALKREGYRKTDLDLRDLVELLSFSGMWRLARRYWSVGLDEWCRSVSKGAFVRALQRLVPDLRPQDLVPSEAGVRAQAVDRSGSLLDDFEIVPGPHAVHVLNVPSPAATASLAIARVITDMFKLDGEHQK